MYKFGFDIWNLAIGFNRLPMVVSGVRKWTLIIIYSPIEDLYRLAPTEGLWQEV
jgi:hypothetical protein